MKRAVATMVVVVGLGAGSALSATSTATVRALVWERNTLSLATLDATSLTPRRQQLDLGRAHGSVFTDRLGDRLAVASEGAGIVVVDARRWKIAWRLRRGYAVRGVAWLSPTRLLVAEHGSVLLVDPVRGRIVAQTAYGGQVIGAARWRSGLVMLAQHGNGSIAPARLIVAGPGARVRSVEIGRIAAGNDAGEDGRGPFRIAHPGFAIDSAAARAFVAGGMEIAVVDLRTGAVSYRGAERTEQKVASGPRRVAAWLGAGTLAVSGADMSSSGEGPAAVTSLPFGLRYVGRDGVRVVDELATEVEVIGELALAFGSRYSAGRLLGMGLAAYDRGGVLRWRLFGDTPVDGVTVMNGLAYVWVGRRLNVVEPATGAVLGGTDVPRMRSLQIVG